MSFLSPQRFSRGLPTAVFLSPLEHKTLLLGRKLVTALRQAQITWLLEIVQVVLNCFPDIFKTLKSTRLFIDAAIGIAEDFYGLYHRVIQEPGTAVASVAKLKN